jgi:glycerol-3-phosphate O-acyltransferase
VSFPPDPTEPLVEEPNWPQIDSNTLVLIDGASRFERRILEGWVSRRGSGDVGVIRLTPSRRRRAGERTDPALAARLARGDNPTVFAARVVWLPREREGRRTARWVDVLKLGDPRDPDPLRQMFLFSRFGDRVRIVLGTEATAEALMAAHRDSVEVQSLTDFVTIRAHRSLDRAERQLRGNRYKVPKLVPEEILARSEFRDGVMRIAAETGMPVELGFARARYYLREIAASHSPFLIDLIANAIHWLYRQGYGEIVYDKQDLAGIAALGEEHSLAFVPSHRSNLDRLSLQFLLWENDLPPNHTAAGINMNFFPVGPLIRRTGAFFIRRSFKDKPLYKFVLRSYLEYLIEKRFSLEWYMEGGRSRSGKLLPPRYGMLAWVVEALQRGKSDDFYLIPTSIAYDQIQDVAAYAAEAQGAAKQKESFGWLYRSVRSLRRRYGNIHVRFGEPMSVAKELGADFAGSDHALEKLAFAVMYQIGRITPITPTAVVSIALLWDAGRPTPAATLAERAARIDAYIERMGLPTTEPIRLEQPIEVIRRVGSGATV